MVADRGQGRDVYKRQNLYKAGRDDFHYCISNDIDMDWVDAVRIRAKLKNAKIGILGFRAHGFFNLAFDELTLYKEIGVLIDHYELTDIWNPVSYTHLDVYKRQTRQSPPRPTGTVWSSP